MKRVFFYVSHKGETSRKDDDIKGTGVRVGVGAGGRPRERSVRPQGFFPGRWLARPVSKK